MPRSGPSKNGTSGLPHTASKSCKTTASRGARRSAGRANKASKYARPPSSTTMCSTKGTGAVRCMNRLLSMVSASSYRLVEKAEITSTCTVVPTSPTGGQVASGPSAGVNGRSTRTRRSQALSSVAAGAGAGAGAGPASSPGVLLFGKATCSAGTS